MNTINVSNDDFGAVCNCAIRYCLGRRSYMPALVIDFITPYIRYLSDKTIWCLKHDIESYKNSGGDFGYDFDERKWMEFLVLVNKENDRRSGIDYDKDIDDVLIRCPECDGQPTVKEVGDNKELFVCVCSECGWTPVKNNEASVAQHLAKLIWNKKCKNVIELQKLAGKM